MTFAKPILHLILHRKSIRNSKQSLVQMAVGRSDCYRKDRIGLAITQRGGDVIADLAAAKREPGDVRGPGQSELLSAVSTAITTGDNADIELARNVTGGRAAIAGHRQ